VAPNQELERAILLEYVRDYVLQEKDSLAMNYEAESKLPYQSADFIVASRKKQLFDKEGQTMAEPLQFIPLS